MTKHKVKGRTKAHGDLTSDVDVIADRGAYMGLIELLNRAYKVNGVIGMLTAASDVLDYADQVATVAERHFPGAEKLARCTVATMLTQEYVPEALKQMKAKPQGSWNFELSGGGVTDFPETGQVLKSWAEAVAESNAAMSVFHQLVATISEPAVRET